MSTENLLCLSLALKNVVEAHARMDLLLLLLLLSAGWCRQIDRQPSRIYLYIQSRELSGVDVDDVLSGRLKLEWW